MKFDIGQRVTFNGLEHRITSIDHTRQKVTLFNLFVGSSYDVDFSALPGAN